MSLRIGTSSLRPYKYYTNNGGVSYHFLTTSGLIYSLATTDFSGAYGIPQESNCRLIFFVLSLEKGASGRTDPRVKDTVVSFILRSLRRDRNVIFYVCSARDKYEKARQRLFTRWYRQTRPSHISHVQRTVDGDVLYFVFHSENNVATQMLDLIDQYNLAGR